MRTIFLSIIEKYQILLKDWTFARAFFSSIAFLIIGFVVNFYAGLYATEKASSPVTDIILSNIPVFDLQWIFVWGAIIFWIFIVLLILYEPKQIPFTLKATALFIIVRAIFISLTHIGPFPTMITPDPESIVNEYEFMMSLFFGKDLFFSGHTGLPFLMALVFWRSVTLRYFFIAAAIMFGAVVLMAHLHYSIDVLSAFFITYGIYKIALKIFPKDEKLFREGLPTFDQIPQVK